MRFLIDMPLSPQLAAWLRENGHEADHASTVGLHGARDSHYRSCPPSEPHHHHRITADLDFPQLLAISHAKDPGIIVFPGGNYNEQGMRQLIKRVLELYPENKFLHTITVVDKVRIRHCPLPIE
jgi:predicted nuclease of predicted toxin-antitoxin system